ncbi:hypothetical protein [Actinosynnema pretiosum]|uniref:Uncharacterized protein n=1 Tax=Actinosynnema pretiosum TaxID=42197 RepID=A0A290ZEM3_9PSEU|nr:hypothetical protein [Actinosynnema pretiosum]ATE57457.1 hypothetical protein CNX65_32545 [Actinosynnema pretiosum]
MIERDRTARAVELERLLADSTGLAEAAFSLTGELIEGLVQRLPHELETLTRTASYGSWSNFFLREARGQVAVPITRSRCGW